ncbi:hypothetical protein BDN71DRAFT_707419 [Pleurotus eryngii]|uniref:Uncharacterized protein n=1 Tax=Pleurotus eryngii TaxID=5323 RepID=A0A9P6A941_PLEER|nr:hypothetical protein BDN71DRAFT_707419 [Pleurotus eryngii]
MTIRTQTLPSQCLGDPRITFLPRMQAPQLKRTVKMARARVSCHRLEGPRTTNLPLRRRTLTSHHPTVKIATKAIRTQAAVCRPALPRTSKLPHPRRTPTSRRLTVKIVTKAIQTQAAAGRPAPLRGACLPRIQTPHRPRDLRTISLLHLPQIRMHRLRRIVMMRKTCLNALRTICHHRTPRLHPWLQVWAMHLLPQHLPRIPMKG